MIKHVNTFPEMWYVFVSLAAIALLNLSLICSQEKTNQGEDCI